jgi:cytochrome o ubiquinol oxidase subunit II
MINGDGFPDMHFDVHAITPQQFAEWAERTRSAGGATLDEQSYRALLVQGVIAQPYTYASVQPGLFDAIVLQKLPPGEGPKPTVPGLSSAVPGSLSPSLASTSPR